MREHGDRARRPAARPRGFSLVELMIAMTLGLFVIATIGYVFLGAKQSYTTLDALSRMQENARFAFDYMGADIRMAGYSSGPQQSGSPPQNVVNSATTTAAWDPSLIDLYGTPLRGYDEGDTAPSIDLSGSNPKRLAGTDALTVVHADNRDEYSLSAHTSNFVLSFATCPSSNLPEQGEIFVASDYTHSAVFQISSVTGCSGGAMTVNYDTGGVTPGNNTPTSLGTFNGPIEARKLYPLRGATYFIANNDAGVPALYRFQLGHTGSAATAEAVELVEGVQDMQIEYGVDAVFEAPTEVKEVTAYHPANLVADWSRVYSVRITLTLQSDPDTNVATTGGPITKTFRNTIAVRNRLL